MHHGRARIARVQKRLHAQLEARTLEIERANRLKNMALCLPIPRVWISFNFLFPVELRYVANKGGSAALPFVLLGAQTDLHRETRAILTLSLEFKSAAHRLDLRQTAGARGDVRRRGRELGNTGGQQGPRLIHAGPARPRISLVPDLR